MQNRKYKRLKCATNVLNNSIIHQTKTMFFFSLVKNYLLFIYPTKTLMIVQYFTACDQNIAVTFGYQNITHMCLSEPEHPDV